MNKKNKGNLYNSQEEKEKEKKRNQFLEMKKELVFRD